MLEAGPSGLDAAVFEGAADEGAGEPDEGDSLCPLHVLERPWRAELDVMAWTLVPQLVYWARWMLLPVRSKTAAFWC